MKVRPSFFLFLLLGSVAGWSETPSEFSPRELWKLIEHQGRSIGYLHVKEQAGIEPGTFQVTVRSMVGIAFPRSPLREEHRTVHAVLNTKGGLRSFRIQKEGGRHGMVIQGVLRENSLLLSIQRGTRPALEKTIEVTPPVYLPDYMNVPLSFMRPGNSLSLAMFNDHTLNLDVLSVTYLNMEDIDYQGRKVEALKTRLALRGRETFNYFLPDGTLAAMNNPLAGIRMVDCTEQDIRNTPITPYTMKLSIPLQGRLPAAGTLRQWTLGAVSRVTPDLSTSWFEDSRQILRVKKEEPPVVILNIHALAPVFQSGRGSLAPRPLPAAFQALRPTGLRDLQDLGNRFQDVFPDPLERGWMIHQFVHQFIRDKRNHRYQTLEEILESRSGDCKAHAQLGVQLALWSGLPARYCIGLVVERRALRGHAWMTFQAAGRWLPVDPARDEFPITPHYLQQAEGDDEALLFFDFQTALQKLQNYRFEVLEVETGTPRPVSLIVPE